MTPRRLLIGLVALLALVALTVMLIVVLWSVGSEQPRRVR
jgi:nitrogen fixation-related uncharacterized protein